jgi:predicted transcriptional regulator
MDEWMKQALEIVKAQAQVRVMTEDEITTMIQRLTAQLKCLLAGTAAPEGEEGAGPKLEPKKAVREKSIICLESGKSFKVLTKKHLAKFGLTPDEYRAKWGYPKGMPLICKGLQRERRKKMKEMKLWQKREKA